MPREPYTPYPTSEPGSASGVYNHAEWATPEAFGGLIGRGEKELGEGIGKLGEYWGKVQTDDALNSYMEEADKATEDFEKKKGADAANSREGLEQNLDEIRTRYRSQLAGPSQVDFDNASRAFRSRYLNGKIATHDVRERYNYSSNVFAKQAANAENRIRANPESERTFNDNQNEIKQAFKNQRILDGRDNDPDEVKAGDALAEMTAEKARIETIGQNDPVRALEMIQDKKAKLGEAYKDLNREFYHRAQIVQAQFTDDLSQNKVAPAFFSRGPEAAKAIVREPANWKKMGEENGKRLLERIDMWKEMPATAVSPSTGIVKPEGMSNEDWSKLLQKQLEQKATRAAPRAESTTNPVLLASKRAIRSNESGSPEGNYREVGPDVVAKDGSVDNAFGAYQVMGKNVGDWTEKWYGRRLAPREFLNNREAQDAVFDGQFGMYLSVYGNPASAARAWFAGPGGMNNLDATDRHWSVKKYHDEFLRNFEAASRAAEAK